MRLWCFWRREYRRRECRLLREGAENFVSLVEIRKGIVGGVGNGHMSAINGADRVLLKLSKPECKRLATSKAGVGGLA